MIGAMDGRRRDRRIALLLVLLTAVPLLWPAIPPFGDLPGHMGRFHVALSLADVPALQQYYDYHWQLIGNLGVDLLVMPLAPVLGLEPAIKLIVLAIPVLTAAGFLLVARAGHGRLPAAAPFALPLAYCYPLHYGFVNYCLAMALTFLAFALWLHLSRRGAIVARSLLFLAIAPAIWLAHAVGWALLCVMCGVAEIVRARQAAAGWPAAIGRAILGAVPLGLPLVLTALGPHQGPLDVSGFFDPMAIAKWIASVTRDRWMVFDLAAAAILWTLVGVAAIRAFGLRFVPLLGWPALALGLLYLIAPQAINGSYFISARIVPYALALALLAIDERALRPERRRLLALAALAFFAIRTAGTTASLLLYDRAYARNLEALALVPQGGRIAVFAAQGCRPRLSNWGNSRLQHLGGIALARRDAFVNDQWAIGGLQLLGVHHAAAAPFVAEPSEVVTLEPCARFGVRYLPAALAALPRRAFDFVWLLDVPAGARPTLPWLTPLFATEEGALYRVTVPGRPGSSAG